MNDWTRNALAANPDAPHSIATREDVDAAIRRHWTRTCEDFPNALTPAIARRVAEDFGLPVSRVFDAFPAPREDA